MHELAPHQVTVTDSFWAPRLEMNARDALAHQWEQLVASGCIENFRIAAGQSDAFREGWFFADSDAYKWLEAASRALVHHPTATLTRKVDDLIALLAAAQQPDGYLYTYNQIHFPHTRWENLQIEHELYCHGHLIEAGVSHHQATGRRDLMALAEKAADRIVDDLQGAGPRATPGHEEIEIALLRLYRATGRGAYLDMGEQFLDQRGRVRPFAPLIRAQNSAVGRRSQEVKRRRQEYQASHPGESAFRLPPGNVAARPRGIGVRYYLSALTGNYFQQHRPVHEQWVPVGHAVRFAYLETAAAMLCRERGGGPATDLLRDALEAAWAHMVARRMYVTGGIGSLPALEGFGRDYELDPEYAYAETCAALGSMFWNWEMTLLTGEARYADLFEWQLYNAASVGMGLDGRAYLYNNPLASRGGVRRRPWYAVPCCPS
ncbi:MAG TPA: beta-L-arabinofuranosidase domain-containing protein, partial [Anaerolineae bacterium]|nr:beta-L-arabinofuranosidase domain-containing protein [Anaerolineae bacterium]